MIAEVLLQLGEALLRGGEVAQLGFGDQRAHPVDPLAALERAADGVDHLVDARERHRAGVDRLAPGRLLAQLRDVHVAESRSAPACAGSASRSSPARRRPRPCVPARGADARRSGAARRRSRARDRGTRPRPGTAHACRPEDRARRPRGGRVSRRAPCRARARSGSRRASPPPRRAAPWSCGAGARGFRSAPSARPAARLRSTVAAASSATTVLPEPTSPCSSRSMRSGLARSASISSIARACEDVSE